MHARAVRTADASSSPRVAGQFARRSIKAHGAHATEPPRAREHKFRFSPARRFRGQRTAQRAQSQKRTGETSAPSPRALTSRPARRTARGASCSYFFAAFLRRGGCLRAAVLRGLLRAGARLTRERFAAGRFFFATALRGLRRSAARFAGLARGFARGAAAFGAAGAGATAGVGDGGVTTGGASGAGAGSLLTGALTGAGGVWTGVSGDGCPGRLSICIRESPAPHRRRTGEASLTFQNAAPIKLQADPGVRRPHRAPRWETPRPVLVLRNSVTLPGLLRAPIRPCTSEFQRTGNCPRRR